MTRGAKRDDAVTRDALLIVIEAIRTMTTDSSRGLELLDAAEKIAERIDRPRGKPTRTEESTDD